MADLVYHDFYSEALKALHNVNTSGHSLKLALFTATHTPNADATGYAGLANEVANGNGYTTGGKAVTGTAQVVTDDDTNDWVVLDITEDIVWAASTITARYAVLYNDTHASKGLICLFDFVTDKSSSAGNFTVQFNASGVLRLS